MNFWLKIIYSICWIHKRIIFRGNGTFELLETIQSRVRKKLFYEIESEKKQEYVSLTKKLLFRGETYYRMYLIISRHFSINTNLVANVCKKCYDDCDDDVVLTAVNGRFLQKYDAELYWEFRESTRNLRDFRRRKKVEKEEAVAEYLDDENNDGAAKWIPPASPHNLIEEKFHNDPWALLVVTIFLNRTSCHAALPSLEKFFVDFKGPYDILKNEVRTLEPYFANLGLVKTRATQIWKMSFDYVNKNWKTVKELYGVGKYGEDVYKMFHLGDFSVQPNDRYLKIYKAWYEMICRGDIVPESNSQIYLEEYQTQ